MTSRQWAEVSIAFDTPPEERTERQKALTAKGLCYADWWLAGGNTRPNNYSGLDQALRKFSGIRTRFLMPIRTRRGDTLRASLAALFAAMSQRERREVLGDF